MRVRGEVTCFISSAAAALDGFLEYTLGIGVVSADAFGAGSGSVPTPGGDQDWGGWLWFHAGGALVEFSTTEVGQGMSMTRIQIDSKAMRKIGPNETMFMSGTVAGEVGTATIEFAASTRMLLKLH